MADYYQQYKTTFINTVRITKHTIRPNQLISFRYKESDGLKIAIVLSDGPVDTKLHVLRLNEINPIHLHTHTHRIIDRSVVTDYEYAISIGVFDDRFRLDEYRLPFIRRANAEVFYNTYIRTNKVLSSRDVYRTYSIDKMVDVDVVVPDLQKLNFLNKSIPPKPAPLEERRTYLSKKVEEKKQEDLNYE